MGVFICMISVFVIFKIVSVTPEADIPCAARYGNSGYICVCNATYCDTLNYPTATAGQFTHIYTSNHTPGFNSQQGTVQPGTNTPTDDGLQLTITITVNSSATFQKLKGLGGSFTDSTGLNVKSLSNDSAKNLLSSYYSRTGIEYKLGRVPIGASDFSTRTYTYDDVPGDTSLKYFNLAEEDYNYKIPLIQAASLLGGRTLSLVGAAWTSPSWTKVNHNFLPGYLQTQYLQYWAQYLIRFLDEYHKEGIDFWAVTAGNEPANPYIIPLYNINSVQWLPMAHREYVRDYLGPLLRGSAHNNTKLLTMDDVRWFLQWWMDRVMADPEAAQYIDGVALHWYRDTQSSPTVLDKVFKEYNKFILYTEACIVPRLDPGPKVDLGSWKRAELYIKDIIETLNHWSVGFIDWNMALDTTGGPTFPTGGGTDGPIIVNAAADEFYKNPMFYALGHFSKFIDEGSFRIESTSSSANISHLATLNPDGSTSTFIYNPFNTSISLQINDVIKNTQMNIDILAQSINTVVWW